MSDLGRYEEEDYDGVDLFGLDEFGQPAGLGTNWGALIGATVQTGTAIAMRQMVGKNKYAEGYGALAGVLVGGAMWAMKHRARAAGVTTMLVSAINGGLRQMEVLMFAKEAAKQGAADAAAEAEKSGNTDGMGRVEIEPSATVGLPTIEPSATISGAGLGMPPQLVGAGNYGMSDNPAAKQAELVGPGVSGLGSHFGSTLFG